MNNRRNFYRILHVQPEAPVEIIKASYRSLMTKLKAHPDLGGDHESAVLINQAYAILSDPQRRRKYDETLHSRSNQTRKHATYETPFDKSRPSTPGNFNAYREDESSNPATSHRRCLFCNSVSPLQTNNHCSNCQSPLTLNQSISNNRHHELFGRRTAPRIAKMGTLTIYPSWPHAGYPGRLRDLSTSGLSMLTEYGARPGHIIKFDSNFLKGIARVVSVRVNGTNFLVHASFLTAEFITKAGVFVTEKA